MTVPAPEHTASVRAAGSAGAPAPQRVPLAAIGGAGAYRGEWRQALVGLGVLWGAILLLFGHDARDMARIWWTSSTYGHCLFIVPLIGWLVWQRRAGLAALRPRAWAPALLWLAGGGVVWLLGDAAGLAVLRHGALILMAQGAVGATLGPAVVRGLLFPLFYAFFLVPVGSELEPVLQLTTARIAVRLLDLLHVPTHIEGIFITIPNGYFKVAEACSGAKFLVAMTAYGVLVGNVCFRSWWRRAAFLAGALAVCLLANGVRAFATIYVAYRTTVDAAVGFDHVVYGWLFFALVMVGVMAAAWPFFDRRPGDPAFDAGALAAMPVRAAPRAALLGGALALLIAAPVWSLASARAGAVALRPPALPVVAGWHRVATPPRYPWAPHYAGADYRVQGRYADDNGHIVDLALVTYGRQAEGRELIGFGQGASGPDNDWSWSSPAWAPANARGEVIVAPGAITRGVVSFYRVGTGGLTGSEGRVKLDTLAARLLGRDQRAVAVLVSAEDREGAPAGGAIRAFLAALGDPAALADAAAQAR